MAAIIPTHDHVLLTLETENAEGSGSQREESAGLWREAKPARGEHPEVVAMSEQDCLALGRQGLSDDSIRTRADLRGGFTAGSPVAPDGPAGHFFTDIGGPAPFVRAVIPFQKIVADFCMLCHARQATGLECSCQRTGEHPVERSAAEPISEHHCLQSTEFGERDISATGVLAGTGPFGFPMPDEDETHSALHHEDLLVQNPMPHAIPAEVLARDLPRGVLSARCGGCTVLL